MRKETRLRLLTLMSIGLVLSMSVLFAGGSLTPRSRAQTTSASNSQPQATRADSGQQSAVSSQPTPTPDADAGLRAACADALNELIAARALIRSQDADIVKLKELDALSDQVNSGLKNLRTLDAEEKQKLRDAVEASNREVAAVRGENAVLKKKQVTLWKEVKWGAFGAGVGVLIYVIFGKR